MRFIRALACGIVLVAIIALPYAASSANAADAPVDRGGTNVANSTSADSSGLGSASERLLAAAPPTTAPPKNGANEPAKPATQPEPTAPPKPTPTEPPKPTTPPPPPKPTTPP